MLAQVDLDSGMKLAGYENCQDETNFHAFIKLSRNYLSVDCRKFRVTVNCVTVTSPGKGC